MYAAAVSWEEVREAVLEQWRRAGLGPLREGGWTERERETARRLDSGGGGNL